MTDRDERCGDCRWFQRPQTDTSYPGRCRRYPPRLDRGAQLLPVVSEDDWCGEFEPKDPGMPPQPGTESRKDAVHPMDEHATMNHIYHVLNLISSIRSKVVRFDSKEEALQARDDLIWSTREAGLNPELIHGLTDWGRLDDEEVTR